MTDLTQRFQILVAQSSMLSTFVDNVQTHPTENAVTYMFDAKIPCKILLNADDGRYYDIQDDVNCDYTMLEQFNSFDTLEELVRVWEKELVEEGW